MDTIAEKARDIKTELTRQHERTELLSQSELNRFKNFHASKSWARKFARDSGWHLEEVHHRNSTSAVVDFPCKHCQNAVTPNRAEYTPFRTEPYPSGLHIENKDGSPTHCFMCVLAITSEEKSIYVGFLHSTESKNYIKQSGRLSKAFREEGIAVIKGAQRALLWPVLCSLNKYVTTKGEPTCLNDSVAKFDLRNHEGRLWENIYPGEDRKTRKVFEKEQYMHKATIPLTTFLEELLFTHEYYARNAFNTMISSHTKFETNPDFGKATKPYQYKRLLLVDHINLFFRRYDVKDRQNLHTDGNGVGVVAIFVEKCGSDGYSFHYVPKSHHRISHSDSDRHLWVPASEVKELKVQQGELLIFSPSLIHAGGQASSKDCKHCKFINYIPGNREKCNYDDWTDISFQFTMKHALFPSPISPGKGRIFPYKNDEGKGRKAILRNEKKIDVQIDQQRFKDYVKDAGMQFKSMLDKSLSDWIQYLNGERVYNTRSRVRSN